jgi:uncharacterized protein YjbJ (UPF0337 family)
MMSKYQILGGWLQTKGYVKHKWFLLTGDQLGQMRSHREIIVGKTQENYQIAKQSAEQCVGAWERRFNSFG